MITGASTGIGAALAKAFAKQGAIVGLHYFSSEDAAKTVASEIRGEGGRIELIKADVSDSQAIAGAVREAAEDCVGAYLFLASKHLAGYVIGQTIEVNGGQLMP